MSSTRPRAVQWASHQFPWIGFQPLTLLMRAVMGVGDCRMATYRVNPDAVAKARSLIDARRYRLRSRWADVQPRAAEQNAFLKSHTWEEYGEWHLALNEDAADETKARYAFVFGDYRRLHRMGLIACYYRAAEWTHTEVQLAAHGLLLYLDTARA